MKKPSILTIILNFQTPELTLKSAHAAVREMRDLGGEVLIVDNASPDDSYDVISQGVLKEGWIEEGLVRVVQTTENSGFGAGNNYGIQLGLASGQKPDFVYILNSDAWPDPGAVGQLLEVMRQDPKVGIAGSHVRGLDDETHCTLFRFPTAAGEFEGAARTGVISKLLKNSVVPVQVPRQTLQVDWVAGASMILRYRMLEEIGLFDETFFLYYEETELCHRAAQAGWKTLYVPDSRVVHIGSASTGLKTWTRTPQYWFDSRLYYFTKIHGKGYAASATIARISGGLLYELRRLGSDKAMADPPRFLRDLVAHSVAAMFRRSKTHPTRNIPRIRRPMTKDSK